MEPIFGLHLQLDRQLAEPLAVQLYRQLSRAIVEQRLQAGTWLPASRQLAQHLGVARNTVVQVYERLASEGLVASQAGSGTRVCQLHRPAPSAAARPDAKRWVRPLWQQRQLFAMPEMAELRFDFGLGLADTRHFPAALWRRYMNRALRQQESQPQPLHWQGYPPLRELIGRFVSQSRAVSCAGRQVLVCNGAQQAFSLIGAALVTPGVTTVAVESPGYPMARQAFEAAGAHIVEVPVDQDGLVVDAIPEGVDLVYVTPSHQFPTTVVMSQQRRLALLALAKARDLLVIEDDYDSEFLLAGQPIDALQTLDQDGRVLYVGSFSKCMFHDLRLGYLIVPDWAAGALVLARQSADLVGAMTVQLALADFIRQGDLRRHIRTMRQHYRAKYLAIGEALAGTVLRPVPMLTGVHMALEASDGRPLAEVAKRAQQAGINLCHSSLFGKEGNLLLLGLGPIALEAIPAAMAALKGCL
ncbi:PLP-dependent aminotransferase family protein [Gallaecimonas pentaromativorans]|uniref:GntR family transcriptional regulator n=1 Tax=Gallaecimonas pentaromativorans TaxID=584787 RepID=A0A3N1P8J0_9GAMM|nr:PLP-dependent aminotransferase family protein [Gallaecimonas pentaromativorans]ROQ23377.1 GntR family transcriptional regulator [Gallaecimonas pentaromativorans]